MPQRKTKLLPLHPVQTPTSFSKVHGNRQNSGMGAKCSAVRPSEHPAYQAPHPEKPIACRIVRINCEPKMKKKAIKLNELSDL